MRGKGSKMMSKLPYLQRGPLPRLEVRVFDDHVAEGVIQAGVDGGIDHVALIESHHLLPGHRGVGEHRERLAVEGHRCDRIGRVPGERECVAAAVPEQYRAAVVGPRYQLDRTEILT